MKIREVRIQNFRSFGPDLRTISFVDPLTDQVRPLSVLVGSNGSGKTTVLEVIAGLFEYALSGDLGVDPGEALHAEGFADLAAAFGEATPADVPRAMRIALGRDDRTSIDFRQAFGPADICGLSAGGSRKDIVHRDAPREALDDGRVR